ncbi:MAG: UDP-N-acetylglucosamine--N-acetylmuramyl-(pentapeptide) pyrophosphoryl-undecaprenol N-acetylglucosamine transferase [Gemmatimonadota bacterium]
MAERILIAGGGTGGHLVPALNLAAALRRAAPACELLLVGAERGVEARVLPTSGYDFRLLPMEPLRRTRPWENWKLLRSGPKVLGGVAAAFRTLDPHVVLGTGGYASGPALAYAIAARRPTAIQEQNAWPGLATRLLAPQVNQVHLGYPEAAAHLKPGRGTEVQAHGNPVALLAKAGGRAGPAGGGHPAAPDALDWPAGRIVLVTGGSQGARGLNDLLLRDLSAASTWPEQTTLVWISGPANLEAVTAAVRGTPWADRIRILAWVDGLGACLGGVSLAISRAGAMTCAEFAAAGVPACLVPLPTSAGDHQRHNAKALAAAGGARVFEQDEAAPGALWSSVVELMGSEAEREAMARAMRGRGRPDAADRIAADLLRLAGKAAGGGRRHADD